MGRQISRSLFVSCVVSESSRGRMLVLCASHCSASCDDVVSLQNQKHVTRIAALTCPIRSCLLEENPDCIRLG